jgi:hypothetical protein
MATIKNTTNVVKDVEEKDPSCTVGGTINYNNYHGKQYEISSKKQN